MVDKNGRKMSKSKGNALDTDELLSNYGADVLRWFISSLAYENDSKTDTEFIDAAGESYRKIRNTVRFLLSNLGDFEASCDGKAGMCVDLSAIPAESIDAWMLGETRKLYDQVTAAYASCETRRVHLALFDFCNETLSAVYLAAVKDRLYCDRADSPRRRQTQTVLWDVAATLITLLAPILPHTADEAWRVLMGAEKDDAATCVQLETFASVPEVHVDPAWTRVLAVRDQALKALEDAKARGIENPLDAEVVIPDPKQELVRFDADLADLLGVSRVSYTADAEAIEVLDITHDPRCERSRKRDGTVRERSDGGMLSDRDAEAIGV